MEAIIHCIEYPGSNSIILRRTIPDLKRTVLDKFENDIPKSLYERGSQERGTYNKSDHIVYFPPVLVDDWDPDTDTPIIDPATGEPVGKGEHISVNLPPSTTAIWKLTDFTPSFTKDIQHEHQ